MLSRAGSTGINARRQPVRVITGLRGYSEVRGEEVSILDRFFGPEPGRGSGDSMSDDFRDGETDSGDEEPPPWPAHHRYFARSRRRKKTDPGADRSSIRHDQELQRGIEAQCRRAQMKRGAKAIRGLRLVGA